jgi:structural maintenance of chromosome 4
VAPDMDTATRWAYNFGRRWRVVTMDGQLIETSGTMAGGGKSVRRGGMKLASGNSNNGTVAMVEDNNDADDAAELERLAQQAMQEYKSCRETRRALAEEIRGLEKKIKSLTVKIPKLEMEVSGCDTTRETLTKSIPELRAASTMSAADASKLKGLKDKVGKCKSDMASCAMLASKLEAEVAKLQKDIVNAGGEKLKKQVAKVDAATTKLNDANTALNTARVAVTSSEKSAVKADEEREAAEKQLEEEAAKLVETGESLKTLEAEALIVMQTYEAAQETVVAKNKELEGVHKELEELKDATSKLKLIEVDLLGKVADYEKALKEHNGRTKFWKDEIAKVRGRAQASGASAGERSERKRKFSSQRGTLRSMPGASIRRAGKTKPLRVERAQKKRTGKTKTLTSSLRSLALPCARLRSCAPRRTRTTSTT